MDRKWSYSHGDAAPFCPVFSFFFSFSFRSLICTLTKEFEVPSGMWPSLPPVFLLCMRHARTRVATRTRKPTLYCFPQTSGAATGRGGAPIARYDDVSFLRVWRRGEGEGGRGVLLRSTRRRPPCTKRLRIPSIVLFFVCVGTKRETPFVLHLEEAGSEKSCRTYHAEAVDRKQRSWPL